MTEPTKALPPIGTVASAIETAQALRSQPELLLDSRGYRRIIGALLEALEASPCYFKAVRLGEPSFTLRAHDLAGHTALDVWATLSEQHGCRPDKVQEARKLVSEWRERSDLRWPD